MTDSVCPKCGAKCVEVLPSNTQCFACGTHAGANRTVYQSLPCKLSQRDQEIERLRNERDEARTAARTLLANMTPLKNGGVVYDSHNKWPWLKE